MNDLFDNFNLSPDEININGRSKLKKPYEQPAFAVTRFEFDTVVMKSSNVTDNGYVDFGGLDNNDDDTGDEW